MSNTYQIGQRPILTGTFKDENGTLADPTTVVCKVKDPAGTETTYAVADGITNPSTGVYEFELPEALSQAGRWYYRFDGTGALDAGGEADFMVETSAFTTP